MSVQDGQGDQSNPNDANKIFADQSYMSSMLAQVSLSSCYTLDYVAG